MRHDRHMKGTVFSLRPVEESDAEFIVELRNDPELTRYLPPVPSVAAQMEWLREYWGREDDYYFTIIRTDNRERQGFVSLYNLDRGRRTAEWGRWIVCRKSLAATESFYLIHVFAFEIMGLELVTSRIMVENRAVISFHEECGERFLRDIPASVMHQGTMHDIIEMGLFHSDWEKTKEVLSSKIAMMARFARSMKQS